MFGGCSASVCCSSSTGRISACVETGTGVCDCRSTLGRVDDCADGGAPGLLATGAFGPQTLEPFLILKLMMAMAVFNRSIVQLPVGGVVVVGIAHESKMKFGKAHQLSSTIPIAAKSISDYLS